jgi:catechol 2,3-dioxygenase-like lactoylglutathione lyase family enzyme
MTSRIRIAWIFGAALTSATLGCAMTPESERAAATTAPVAETDLPESIVMFPAINVLDLEATEAFYVDMLGLKPSLRIGEPGDERQEVTLNSTGDPRSPGASLVLDHVAARQEPYVHGALSRIAFRVRDLDAVLARIRRAGHEVLEEPRTIEAAGMAVRLAFVRDPNGTRVELIQLLAPTSRDAE